MAKKSIKVTSAQVATAKPKVQRANAKGVKVEPGVAAIASARKATGSGTLGRKSA